MTSLTPAEVARHLSIPDRTLRYWSSRFAAYLSADAVAERRERGSGHRRFSEADLTVLATIKGLAAQKVPLSQIEDALRQGALAEPPPRPPAPAGRKVEPSAEERVAPSSLLASVRPPSVSPSAHGAPEAAVQEARAPRPTSAADLPVDGGPVAGDRDGAGTVVGAHRHEAEVAQTHALERRVEEIAKGITALQVTVDELTGRLCTLEEAYAALAQAVEEPCPVPLPWPFSLLFRRQRSRRTPLARRLARLMAERMWTRRELARAAQLDVKEVDDLLTGRQPDPSPYTIEAVAAALGLSTAELRLDPPEAQGSEGR